MKKVHKHKLRTKLALLYIVLGTTLSIWVTYRFVIDLFVVKSSISVFFDRLVYGPILFFLSLGLVIFGILEFNGNNKRNEKLLQQKEEEKWERLKELDKLFESKVNSSKKKRKKQKKNR
ncbi:hypothetical protein [Aquimarina litoralis]|uniref:hypothetical protein n=1 Tax=Aquimarina litoralis TaxID=584605 RepID=UPI001C586895|nr:hypothetical protein [Aquimarina litoralis]MBW1298469.1 hypothetical protein [Aquimarina litoralis]